MNYYRVFHTAVFQFTATKISGLGVAAGVLGLELKNLGLVA